MTPYTSNQTECLNLAMVPAAAEIPRYAGPVRRPARSFNFHPLVRLVQHLGTFLLVVSLSVAAYFGINRFLMEVVEVVGVSMVPTLQEHGHYVLNRLAFRNREPERSDVVVIRDPADNGYSVKRIIATAGQSVYFKNGKVFVDGKELQENYLAPGTHTFTYSKAKEQLITCGKDQYFVLGDNRLKSIDSRSYGPVPRDNVLGLVVVR